MIDFCKYDHASLIVGLGVKSPDDISERLSSNCFHLVSLVRYRSIFCHQVRC